jgi:hypothetical protein
LPRSSTSPAGGRRRCVASLPSPCRLLAGPHTWRHRGVGAHPRDHIRPNAPHSLKSHQSLIPPRMWPSPSSVVCQLCYLTGQSSLESLFIMCWAISLTEGRMPRATRIVVLSLWLIGCVSPTITGPSNIHEPPRWAQTHLRISCCSVHAPVDVCAPFDAPSAGPHGCPWVPPRCMIATASFPLYVRSSTVVTIATRGAMIQVLVVPSPLDIH